MSSEKFIKLKPSFKQFIEFRKNKDNIIIADVLGVDVADLKKADYDHYGLAVYSGNDDQEWVIGKYENVRRATEEYIKENLWTFKPEFLAKNTRLPAVVFELLQKECENANDAIRGLIEKTCGIRAFIYAAIKADGRGHFLAFYDGKEKSETFSYGEWFGKMQESTLYFYRIS